VQRQFRALTGDSGGGGVTHIKTIAQFDCTSYPTRAHPGPLPRLWDRLEMFHQVEKKPASVLNLSLFCLTFLSWMPCILVWTVLFLFLFFFFNSRANSSVCYLLLGVFNLPLVFIIFSTT